MLNDKAPVEGNVSLSVMAQGHPITYLAIVTTHVNITPGVTIAVKRVGE